VKATELRLLYTDEATGEQRTEVMPRAQAETMAEESGLDLVVISLESSPPVIRLIDYGKFKYDQEKKQREAKKKQHVTEVKEVKMTVRIDDHDYQVKVARAKKFLQEHDKVKLTIRLKGREVQHSNLALDLANQFVLDLQEDGNCDTPVRADGRTISVIMSPKTAASATGVKKK
jgi:translation initiation factor IF-3